ncbi:hypothetical protein ACA910_002238 [Epithemia clementina (nom. ined.)]
MEAHFPASQSSSSAASETQPGVVVVNTMNARTTRRAALVSANSASPSALISRMARLKGLKPADVLLGRGKGSYEHRGNMAYMNIIFSYLPAYTATNRNKDKSHITNEVVALVKKSGGRFLGIDPSNHELYEVSDAEARIKVSQALRHQRLVLDRKRRKKTGKVSNNCLANSHKAIKGGDLHGARRPVAARHGDPKVIQDPVKQQQELSDDVKSSVVTSDAVTTGPHTTGENDSGRFPGGSLGHGGDSSSSTRMICQSCPVVAQQCREYVFFGADRENIPKGTANEGMLRTGEAMNESDVLDGLVEYAALLMDILGVDGHCESSS